MNTNLNDNIKTHLIHDLRAPLSIMKNMGASPTLEKEMKDNLETCTNYLELILNKYFSIETKKVNSQSIHEKINDKLNLFSDEGIEFKKSYSAQVDNLTHLNISTLDFSRLLFNFLSNSLQELKEVDKKKIQIKTYNCQKNFYLSLSDNGCGFPPELLNGMNIPSHKRRGLGIGLSSVYTIIKESGGQITLSNHPRGGANVILQIPLVPEGKKLVASQLSSPDGELFSFQL